MTRRPAAPAQPLDFTPEQSQTIAHTAATDGWQTAAHDVMRACNHRAYRLAVDEYRAQMRFLLPLTEDSRVLLLRCGWGPVAMNLAQCARVVAMDERPTRLGFVAERAAQSDDHSLRLMCARSSTSLPFAADAFDAVVLLDTLETVAAADPLTSSSRSDAQRVLLTEVRRVLRPNGWLLAAADNRLGFPRPTPPEPQNIRTFWGYRSALEQSGFSAIEFYAPLPSHREPFFIIPLDRAQVLDRFVGNIFTAEDYRSKLEARGLGFAFTIAAVLWSVGQHLRLTRLARYLVPSYLMLARK